MRLTQTFINEIFRYGVGQQSLITISLSTPSTVYRTQIPSATDDPPHRIEGRGAGW